MSTGPVTLFLAFLIDLSVGDPAWLPHPVQIMGRGIAVAEALLRRFFRSETGEKTAGVILVVTIAGLTALAAYGLSRGIAAVAVHISSVLALVLMAWFVATTIAVHGLIAAVRSVSEAVQEGLIVEARRRLSLIVGRDTAHLTPEEIVRASLETLAENLSDGVVAPLFYLVLGGLPLAMAYKAVNTIDSMVGYKNERYRHFGWAGARLDDLANYIPARITGILIVAAAFLTALFSRKEAAGRVAASAFRVMRRDGRNHTSPNSGIPEAAMAGALGLRFGGPSLYSGKMVEKPYIGDDGHGDYVKAAPGALRIGCVTSCLAVVFAMGSLCFWRVM